jgi:hypothetical protein
VRGPAGVAEVVADRDGEAAVVGSDEADDGPLLALDLEAGALATVLGPALRGTCAEKNQVKIKLKKCKKKKNVFCRYKGS